MDRFTLAGPLLRALSPEQAHDLTLWALRRGLAPRQLQADDPILASRLWGLDFANPLGLSAGFDKNAVAVGPLLRLGFGFVEVGSITPRPQEGNPRPRVFRLRADRAVINRLGFNNAGLDAAEAQLRHWRARALPGRLGVNLGKNKESEDAAEDYALGARRLAPLADYLVINVSSPNTPGLRALQGRQALAELIEAVRQARDDAVPDAAPPLLVKIAPDQTDADKEDIAQVALDCRLDGLIVGNTTVTRPEGLTSPQCEEPGGLSGPPLFALSTAVLKDMHRLTGGRVPLIGLGGVASGADAYAKIRAGASLVQLYTALIYQGPGLIGRIKRELADLLRRDGFASVAEAVGADSR